MQGTCGNPMAPEDIFPPLFEYASRSGLLPPPRCRPKQASWGLLILLASLFWVGRLQAFMVQRFRALFIWDSLLISYARRSHIVSGEDTREAARCCSECTCGSFRDRKRSEWYVFLRSNRFPRRTHCGMLLRFTGMRHESLGRSISVDASIISSAWTSKKLSIKKKTGCLVTGTSLNSQLYA